MLDQDTARALLEIAHECQARVAFMGDRHQLPAVGRGGVLDLAAQHAGAEATVPLDVVHRFADPEYAGISLAMRRGERIGEAPGEAESVFDALWRRGQIRLHASEPERTPGLRAPRRRRRSWPATPPRADGRQPRAGGRAERRDP